jgi:hypothetical protein
MGLAAAALLLAAPALVNAAAPAAGHVAVPVGEKNAAFLEKYCGSCHNATDWAGELALDVLDQGNVAADGEAWEKIVRKMRGALMPPSSEPQPSASDRMALIRSLETSLDRAAAQSFNPGSVMLHRLNRREYANAIHDLLDLDVDAAALLPRDDLSGSFDNVAEVLKVTPSFLDQYLSAAREISLKATGNPRARLTAHVYSGSLAAQQYINHPGLPPGTRGGLVIDHDFPVDGEYEISINGLVGGGYVWGVADKRTLIVTLDGDRVFQADLGGEEDLEAIDQKQAQGIASIESRFRNIRFKASAGAHHVGVTFKQKTAAEHLDILNAFSPGPGMTQDLSGAAFSDGYRVSNVEIRGPLTKAGVSDTAARRKLFLCHPAAQAQETPCARQILASFAKRAFRRPVTGEDIANAMQFYAEGRKAGTFDDGIQKGVVAILSSPLFLYRSHTPPTGAKPGDTFRIADLDLASRLSFFLWSSLPDERLIDLAAAGRLKDKAVLESEVRRMLKDPRSNYMVRGFVGRWLNVDGLDLVNTDVLLFPDFTADLIPAFKEELFAFASSVFAEDRNVNELMTANWTYLNERLALHYGIPGIRGGDLRRVTLAEDHRRGLLGKGAVLMATSYANRTSPVVRGAWVLEHLMGTPPAAPPPGVIIRIDEEGGELLTVRQRLESHRTTRNCAACHDIIDPVGLALENFNAIGQWRTKDIDAGMRIDANGRLADGTVVDGPGALRDYIVGRPDLFFGTFAENMLAYALARPLKHDDMPLVRKLINDAGKQDYRLSALVLGIVSSPAFQYDKVPEEAPPSIAAIHR